MKIRVALVCVAVVVVTVLAVLALQPRIAAPPQAGETATATGTPDVVAPSTSPAAAPVPDSSNAADFEVADFERPGVFFVSTSQNLRCGIVADDSGLGQWGCYVGGRTWEFAAEKAADPCFEPPEPFCGDGIDAHGHELPGPLTHAKIDEADFASQWTLEDGPDGWDVETLSAGESVTFAGVTCSAADNNVMNCSDAVTGHGFTVSRLEYTIF